MLVCLDKYGALTTAECCPGEAPEMWGNLVPVVYREQSCGSGLRSFLVNTGPHWGQYIPAGQKLPWGQYIPGTALEESSVGHLCVYSNLPFPHTKYQKGKTILFLNWGWRASILLAPLVEKNVLNPFYLSLSVSMPSPLLTRQAKPAASASRTWVPLLLNPSCFTTGPSFIFCSNF